MMEVVFSRRKMDREGENISMFLRNCIAETCEERISDASLRVVERL